MQDFRRCPGVDVNWPTDLGTFAETFPWSRLGDRPDSLPFDLEIHNRGRSVRAWSKRCAGQAASGGQPCDSCLGVVDRIDNLASIAQDAKPHTSHKFLNSVQLRQLIRDRDTDLQRWKLKALNLVRKVQTLFSRVSDHRRFVMALAENDVPRLRKLLQHAMTRGSSIQTITRKLADAVDGLYSARGFDLRDYDLATLVYRIGGRTLLFSMSHAYGLPSLRALRNSFSFTHVMPTLGRISPSDIIRNIKEVILKTRESAGIAKRCGVSALIDEVAIEEMAMHFKHANCVGGICWKHASLIDLVFYTYESALNIARSIAAGTVHLGKEMTVVAIACFDGRSRVYPILAAATCKQEDKDDMKFIFITVIESWNSAGAAVVGPLWSFATDGDATRRAAGYDVFLKNRLSPSSPLYGVLSHMAGLNLFTGDNDVTLDFDYKHIFKRVCTLLRSPSGITLNNGRIINATSLTRYLQLLPGQDDDSVHTLLYPGDAQDVPRAVELMQGIIAIPSLTNVSADVNVIADLDAIRLLAALLDALLDPFINPDLSLSCQVRSLSKYAHLAFSLFRTHRLAFMSNQLYGDSQTMVKNVMFCIVKQQKMDPSAPFYIFECGDDRLEKLFGRIRMLGGHDSGMNFRQGVERLGHAVDMDAAFLRNPDLDPGQKRLKITRVEGVDHLNASSWKGDVISGHCDLQSAFAAGRADALTLFQSSQVPPAAYDYRTLFSDGEVDFLRPFGQNKYPGVETDTDRSVPVPAATLESGPWPHGEVSAAVPTAIDPDSDVSAVSSQSLGGGKPPNDNGVREQAAETGQMDSGGDDEDLGLTFEEAYSSELDVPALSLPSAPGVDVTDYILVGNKWIHKQSACRLLMNKNSTHKSVERLDRVRGFTKVNTMHRLNTSEVVGPNVFMVGDPILTILRTDKTVSLALLRTTAIIVDGLTRSSVQCATLVSEKSKVKISGQVMRLLLAPTADNCDELLDAEPATHLSDSDRRGAWSWIWSGGYVKVDSNMRGSTETTEKPLVVNVPGHLTEFVNPRIVSVSHRIDAKHCQELNSHGTTWELDDSLLTIACQSIWEKVISSKTPMSAITVTSSKSLGFPYTSDLNPGMLFVRCRCRLLADNGKAATQPCHFCGRVPENWRAHIGMHILRAIRGVSETGLKEEIGNHMPCGFCGRSNHPDCKVSLKEMAQTIHIESKCPYFTTFRYKAAAKGSDTTPCRNVPVVCLLCTEPTPRNSRPVFQHAVWRYNMEEHLAERHAEYASPRNPDISRLPLPQAVWKAMEILRSEELALGIPEDKLPTPFALLGVEAEQDISEVSVTLRAAAGLKRVRNSRGGQAKKARVN
ncbi:hypothetical protein BV25DRAFT_1949134 [Artomyces pyxidatus]|uniref:Uncharacterized protein n=1 Tax=Artomyces pyxidatus TaxID=48021 RepID=A0ACB8SD44_9AGAM|nr:hypothetical protein BV25DRAFT_1949134 [Artomyces pyxidatus]